MNLTPFLVAHRGWQHRFPENSYLAVSKALEAGCQHIEIDVQLNADLNPIVCHDLDLLRLTGEALHLNELDNKAISTLSPHEPERLGDQFNPCPVFYLKDCIQLFANFQKAQLYIEVKEESIDCFGIENCAAAVMNLINSIASDIAERCWLISFSFELLEYLNTNYQHPRLVPVIRQWRQWESLSFRPLLCFSNIKHMPENEDLNSLSCPIAFYEIGEAEQAKQLLNAGAALIETFKFGELSAGN